MKLLVFPKTTLLGVFGFVLSITSLFNCTSQTDAVTPEEFSYSGAKIDLSHTFLKEATHFPIGAAVNPQLLSQDAAYRQLVRQEFNSLTTENALKWSHVHPKPSVYNFSKADTIINVAQQNGMRVHGHVLISSAPSSAPDWVKNFQGDSLAWEQLFKTHIQTVVKHYQGQIHSWDVVNETFDEKGQVRTYDATSKKKNIWAKHLGQDYTARAFQYAHEADPTAMLFYNDYNHEVAGPKLQAILAMVQTFKKRNIPLHGLGLQMHTNITVSDASITNAIKQIAATGLRVHISELDIRMNPSKSSSIDSTANLQQQAKKFYLVANSYKKLVPVSQQFGITFWNVTDKDSWFRVVYGTQDSPLLFNEEYQRKDAYTAFYMGLSK